MGFFLPAFTEDTVCFRIYTINNENSDGYKIDHSYAASNKLIFYLISKRIIRKTRKKNELNICNKLFFLGTTHTQSISNIDLTSTQPIELTSSILNQTETNEQTSTGTRLIYLKNMNKVAFSKHFSVIIDILLTIS